VNTALIRVGLLRQSQAIRWGAPEGVVEDGAADLHQAGSADWLRYPMPCAIAYCWAAKGVENSGMKRNTLSWVAEPWPLRMDNEAAYWPQSVCRVAGDRRNLPTWRRSKERSFK
jgi:hypothetical protein